MNKSRDIKGRFERRSDGEMFEGFPVYLDSKGYKLIYLSGKDIKLHVYVWERVNGPKPEGHEIHHIDEDKGNYELSNLLSLSHSDHQRVHAGWVMSNGEWTHKPCSGCKIVFTLDNFYVRKGYTPTAKCKKCHCKDTSKWAENNKQRRKEIALKHYYKNKREVK